MKQGGKGEVVREKGEGRERKGVRVKAIFTY